MDSFFHYDKIDKIQIIFAQEPPRKPNTNTPRTWPNYDLICPQIDITTTYPYTCIYVHSSVKRQVYKMEELQLNTTYMTGIRIQFEEHSTPANFINVYNHQQDNILPLVTTVAGRYAHEQTHIAGDFNAHHPAWNPLPLDIRTEAETEEMVNELLQHNYTLISPAGVPTRYGYNSETTIDLYWLSRGVENIDTAFCSIDADIDATSDHRPVHLTIARSYQQTNHEKRWNLKKADWEKGKEKLVELLHAESISVEDEAALDLVAQRLTECIASALDACAPELNICMKSKRWWNDDLTRLRTEFKIQWRVWTDGRLQEDFARYKIKRGVYKRAIRIAKAVCWDTYLENIKITEIHRAAKYVNGGRVIAPFIPPLKMADGRETSGPQEQAQVLFDNLLGGDTPDSVRIPHTQTDTGHFPQITIWETAVAINKLKAGKAAGPDRIPAAAVKQFSGVLAPHITTLANHSIRLGHYPKCFKSATCIVLPKANKTSYKEAKSYRPISLLSHVSKIIESIMTSRVQYELSKSDRLPETHFGCRKGTGTDDALFFVTEFIRKAWNEKKVVAALALDAQGAFNNVQHTQLLEDCRSANLPKYLIGWIAGFLRDRSVNFKFANYTSSDFTLTKGSPQGSPISGPLYLLYNKQLLAHSDSVMKIGYADDVLWLAKASTASTARGLIEAELPEADAWSRTHHTPLDLAKTQYVLFTKNNNKKDSRGIVWNERVIAPSECMKYLGVALDSKLLFKQQSAQMVRRGYATAASIGRLANTRKGMATKQFLCLYQTHVCAATDYASHVWIDTYKHGRAIRMLELLQNRMLRKALGAVRTTPVKMLHFDSAMLEPATRIRLQSDSFVARSLSKRPSHIVHRTLTELIRQPKRKFISPLTALVTRTSIIRDCKGVESISPHLYTPWMEPAIGFLQTRLDDDKAQALAFHEQTLARYATSWHFYTDGSLADGKVGAGCVLKRPDQDFKKFNCHLGSSDDYSVYEAELVGLYVALMVAEQLLSSTPTESHPPSILIHTDSQSVLSAIVHFQTSKAAQYIIRRIINLLNKLKRLYGRDTFLTWIPGHMDVEGNELADKEANKGRTDTDENRLSIDFTLRPALSAFRRRLREQHTALLRVDARRLPGPTSKDAERAMGKMSSVQAAKMLNKLPRGARSVATQIRSGHFPTAKSYRYRFNLSNSPRCSVCNEVDSTTHRIFWCRKFKDARLKLRRKIYGLGLRFEMKYMLSNDQALMALYEFFKRQLSSPPRFSGSST